jgi:hypothetical protein
VISTTGEAFAAELLVVNPLGAPVRWAEVKVGGFLGAQC